MKIWAHRGCSQRYPENTMLAFEKAASLINLTGIELDIQLTRDGEMVVIHDERVDRTTEGTGFVKDYTLAEIRKLHIYAGDSPTQRIPTIEEVLELLAGRLKPVMGAVYESPEAAGRQGAAHECEESGLGLTDADAGQETETERSRCSGLRLNIELKNGIYRYEGMEEKIVETVHKYGLQEAVVYSTFYAASLERLKALDPEAEIAILDSRVSDCLYKARGGCGATALHPFWQGMDLAPEKLAGITVRAWMSGHLYPEKPTGTKLDLAFLEAKGITDIILNEPEAYIA